MRAHTHLHAQWPSLHEAVAAKPKATTKQPHSKRQQNITAFLAGPHPELAGAAAATTASEKGAAAAAATAVLQAPRMGSQKHLQKQEEQQQQQQQHVPQALTAAYDEDASKFLSALPPSAPLFVPGASSHTHSQHPHKLQKVEEGALPRRSPTSQFPYTTSPTQASSSSNNSSPSRLRPIIQPAAKACSSAPYSSSERSWKAVVLEKGPPGKKEQPPAVSHEESNEDRVDWDEAA